MAGCLRGVSSVYGIHRVLQRTGLFTKRLSRGTRFLLQKLMF